MFEQKLALNVQRRLGKKQVCRESPVLLGLSKGWCSEKTFSAKSSLTWLPQFQESDIPRVRGFVKPGFCSLSHAYHASIVLILAQTGADSHVQVI